MTLPSPQSRAHGARWLLLLLWMLPIWAPAPAPLLAAETAPPAASAPSSVDDALLALMAAEGPARRAAIESLGRSRDMRLVPFFKDYNSGNIYAWQGRLVLVPDLVDDGKDGKQGAALDPLTRQPLAGAPVIAKGDLTELTISNPRERTWARAAMTMLNLSDPDGDRRLAAVVKAGDSASAANLAALRALATTETNPRVRTAIIESELLNVLADASGAKPGTPAGDTRLAAVVKLGQLGSSRARSAIREIAAKKPDEALTAACDSALRSIERWQQVARGVGYVFSGLSQGSVLVLMALGLSIIFGLMGVINMAHGELMMIGAYSTYLTQQLFVKFLPASLFDWYFPVAIPVAFIIAAVFGWLIELLVIRHLYGRPLETLLATFGVSLILTQLVRVTIGDNIAVNSPSWLQGGVEVMQDVTLPWNRLFILLFCAVCIGLMYWLIERTKLGLLLRATTQNRNMAAALGVPTRRIDGYTFALGAGLAGLAGCALTQIGGVSPDMGQNYIVDSFLVVVTGGVGKLAGAIWAGMGLGCLNKVFEPFTESVWAKVLILAAVVVFMQWRPSGLFPAKGRMADA